MGKREIVYSTCKSCHGGCGVLVEVQDGAITHIEGNPDSTTRGTMCAKGLSSIQHIDNPYRIQYPYKRTGEKGEGKWQRIGWDEALDEIAARLAAIKRDFGAEAIALGTGTGRHHIRWVSRFGHALGTPNWCEPGFAQCFHLQA